MGCFNNGWTSKLSLKFDLDQRKRKSSRVNASARKAWPNEVNFRLFESPFDQGLKL